MPLTTVDANMPTYVLIDGTLRLGPKIVPSDAGLECSAIYGFTAKGLYDKFSSTSQRSLKPYPLVKRYLRDQMDAPGDSLKLVVIDAASPSDPRLCAATFEAVLEAQESRAAQVTAAYRLTFDEKAAAYRVEKRWDVEEPQFDEAHA